MREEGRVLFTCEFNVTKSVGAVWPSRRSSRFQPHTEGCNSFKAATLMNERTTNDAWTAAMVLLEHSSCRTRVIGFIVIASG
jgi:hypothetical protein